MLNNKTWTHMIKIWLNSDPKKASRASNFLQKPIPNSFLIWKWPGGKDLVRKKGCKCSRNKCIWSIRIRIPLINTASKTKTRPITSNKHHQNSSRPKIQFINFSKTRFQSKVQRKDFRRRFRCRIKCLRKGWSYSNKPSKKSLTKNRRKMPRKMQLMTKEYQK